MSTWPGGSNWSPLQGYTSPPVSSRRASSAERESFALHRAGVAAEKRGDFQEAIRLYNRALAIDPRHPQAYITRNNLAKAKARLAEQRRAATTQPKRQKPALALTKHEQSAPLARLKQPAVEQARREREAEQRQAQFHDAGVAAERRGDLKEAIRLFNLAYQVDPSGRAAEKIRSNLIAALNRRGELELKEWQAKQLQLEQQKLEMARREREVREREARLEAERRASEAQLTREKNQAEVLNYRRVIETSSDPKQQATYRALLAKLFHEHGDDLGAIHELSEARRLAPDLPLFVLLHAEELHNSGDRKGAVEELERYVKLEPFNHAAAKLLTVLKDEMRVEEAQPSVRLSSGVSTSGPDWRSTFKVGNFAAVSATPGTGLCWDTAKTSWGVCQQPSVQRFQLRSDSLKLKIRDEFRSDPYVHQLVTKHYDAINQYESARLRGDAVAQQEAQTKLGKTKEQVKQYVYELVD